MAKDDEDPKKTEKSTVWGSSLWNIASSATSSMYQSATNIASSALSGITSAPGKITQVVQQNYYGKFDTPQQIYQDMEDSISQKFVDMLSMTDISVISQVFAGGNKNTHILLELIYKYEKEKDEVQKGLLNTAIFKVNEKIFSNFTNTLEDLNIDLNKLIQDEMRKLEKNSTDTTIPLSFQVIIASIAIAADNKSLKIDKKEIFLLIASNNKLKSDKTLKKLMAFDIKEDHSFKLPNLPIPAVISEANSAVGEFLEKKSEQSIESFDNQIEKLPKVELPILKKIGEANSAVGEFLEKKSEQSIESMGNTIEKTSQKTQKVVKSVSKNIQTAKTKALNTASAIYNAPSDIVSGAKNIATSGISSVSTGISNATSFVTSTVQSVNPFAQKSTEEKSSEEPQKTTESEKPKVEEELKNPDANTEKTPEKTPEEKKTEEKTADQQKLIDKKIKEIEETLSKMQNQIDKSQFNLFEANHKAFVENISNLASDKSFKDAISSGISSSIAALAADPAYKQLPQDKKTVLKALMIVSAVPLISSILLEIINKVTSPDDVSKKIINVLPETMKNFAQIMLSKLGIISIVSGLSFLGLAYLNNKLNNQAIQDKNTKNSNAIGEVKKVVNGIAQEMIKEENKKFPNK